MIMENSLIFHGGNTFSKVSSYQCFIVASLLLIQSQAISVDNYIFTTSPNSNFTFIYSSDHKINRSITHEVKKIQLNEKIKNCNRSEEYITNYNGLNHLSNKGNSSHTHVTEVGKSNKHNNNESKINNKLSNKTGMNCSKYEEHDQNYYGLNDLNNKCNRPNNHDTMVIESDENRVLCYGSNDSRTKYSEVDKDCSECTSSDKLCTNLHLLNKTLIPTSINDSHELSSLSRKIYENWLNDTSFYSSLLNNNTNFSQSSEMKVTGNKELKIPFDVLKKYISQYIQMRIKSIIAHGKINKKKRYAITKSYSHSHVYNNSSKMNELNHRNGSTYVKNNNLDQIYNSSSKNNLFGNKLLTFSCVIYSTPSHFKDSTIKSDSSSKDRHLMATSTSKHCRSVPKVETSISKPILPSQIDKINLDTNFEEADSFQVEKLMNMDNPQLLHLVKALIDREINNNLRDIKIYDGDNVLDRSKSMRPHGYRPYHGENSSLWVQDEKENEYKKAHAQHKNHYGDSREGSTIDFYAQDNDGMTIRHGDVERTNPPLRMAIMDTLPGASTPLYDVLEYDTDPNYPDRLNGDKDHVNGDNNLPHIANENEDTDQGLCKGRNIKHDTDEDSECSSGLCKKTAMSLVITFLSTLVGVLVLVFLIYYLWKACCSPKSRVIYAQPCYESCCA